MGSERRRSGYGTGGGWGDDSCWAAAPAALAPSPKISLSVAVFARDGRGGGATVDEATMADAGGGEGDPAGEKEGRVTGGGALCLRGRLCSTEGDADGGGGAGRFGRFFAAKLASDSSALYSCMDSRDGRWYSTVIFECRELIDGGDEQAWQHDVTLLVLLLSQITCFIVQIN